MNLFHPKNISEKFTFGLMSMILLVLVIFSSALILVNFKLAERKLNDSFDSILNKTSISLPSALWKFNHDYVNDYIDSLFINEDMVYVRVKSDGKIIKERIQSGFDFNNFNRIKHDRQYIFQEQEILFEKYQVGDVVLIMSKARINRQIIKESLIVMVIGFVNIITIFFTAFFLSKRYIFIPLTQLEQSVNEISRGNLDIQINSTSDDEIGKLAKSFNRMVMNLQTTMASKYELEKEVQERKSAEGKLLASVKEKEVLLREIHHRVKNNMQIIQSLLSLQMGKFKDEKLKGVLQDSNNRIKSMALIHETLYQSEDLAKLNIKEYVKHITTFLCKIYVNPDQPIDIQLEVEDLKLDLDKSIASGLIINELLTNALKYAFPHSKSDRVHILFKQDEMKQAVLIVSDNGKGLSHNINIDAVETLGLKIVQMLAQDQLDGTFEIEQGDESLTFCIGFPLTDEEE